MPASPDPTTSAVASVWGLSLADAQMTQFSIGNHTLVSVSGILNNPDAVILQASLQNFAKISPQYPGVRAALDPAVCRVWLDQLGPLLNQWFGTSGHRWEMQAWPSLVTTPPGELAPIQCLPHVDGTDPTQIAMMLYLHHTGHGGTAFFRHRATGFESLTAQDFPGYAAAVQADIAQSGLPPAAYITDGAPHFDRIHAVPGTFNTAVFYRGNILHSGMIDNDAPLSPDPREGRLTINAFFRPVAG